MFFKTNQHIWIKTKFLYHNVSNFIVPFQVESFLTYLIMSFWKKYIKVWNLAMGSSYRICSIRLSELYFKLIRRFCFSLIEKNSIVWQISSYVLDFLSSHGALKLALGSAGCLHSAPEFMTIIASEFLGRATASRIDVCRPLVWNVLRKCPT